MLLKTVDELGRLELLRADLVNRREQRKPVSGRNNELLFNYTAAVTPPHNMLDTVCDTTNIAHVNQT